MNMVRSADACQPCTAVIHQEIEHRSKDLFTAGARTWRPVDHSHSEETIPWLLTGLEKTKPGVTHSHVQWSGLKWL